MPTEACKRLHESLDAAPVLAKWPANGLYFFRENGETWGHGVAAFDRITRCGSHTSPGRLQARAKEHRTQNSNGSAVVKHVGSALARRNDPAALCAHWGAAGSRHCERCAELVRDSRLYLNENIAVIIVGVQRDWMRAETIAIGILSHCEACHRTEHWLGRHALNQIISSGHLWNDKGIDYIPTVPDIGWFFDIIDEPARLPLGNQKL